MCHFCYSSSLITHVLIRCIQISNLQSVLNIALTLCFYIYCNVYSNQNLQNKGKVKHYNSQQPTFFRNSSLHKLGIYQNSDNQFKMITNLVKLPNIRILINCCSQYKLVAARAHYFLTVENSFRARI